jgi:tetratricopeptide (TPR) repeat protein
MRNQNILVALRRLFISFPIHRDKIYTFRISFGGEDNPDKFCEKFGANGLPGITKSIKKDISLLIGGVLFFISVANGQDLKTIDSLEAVLEGKCGADRFYPLYELSFEFIRTDKAKALQLIGEAEEAALLSGDTLSIVKSKRVQAQIMSFMDRIEESRKLLYDILPLAMRHDFKSERLNIEYTLGKLALLVGRYDKALQLYFGTVELAKELGDKETIAFALNSIGMAYYKLKDYPKALDYYKESLKIRSLKSTESLAIFANISLCYAHLADYKNATLYVKKSFGDCGVDCPEMFMVIIEYARGVIAYGEKRFSIAEQHFLQSYRLARRSKDTRLQLDNIYLLAEIYIGRANYQRGQQYLLQAEKLIDLNTSFNLETIKILSTFSELYLKLRDYRRAALYQSKYIELKDSIYNEELTTNLMRTQADFLERENRNKIASQNHVIALKEEIINRQNVLNVVSGLLGLLMMAFIILLFRNYQNKKSINILLNDKIKERTRDLELNRNQLVTTLRERELAVNRDLREINKTLMTIKGLCFTGIKDVSEPVAISYIKRIDQTSSNLSGYLQPSFQQMEKMHFF